MYFKIFKPISWGERPAERRCRFIQRFLKIATAALRPRNDTKLERFYLENRRFWSYSVAFVRFQFESTFCFSAQPPQSCHCEERSDAAIFNGAKRHPGTKHGRGERASFPSAGQQKNPPARPVGLVFVEVLSARIKLRLRSFSHGFCVLCTFYIMSGVKSFGGCSRRPKCHSIASAMRRQACPSP